jgi:hypothetical protein
MPHPPSTNERGVDDEVDERDLHRRRESEEVLRSREETEHDEGIRLDVMMGDFFHGPF